MFSFNTPNTPQSKSRRRIARAALAGLLCLASAFLFLSCPMEGSTGGGGGDGGGGGGGNTPTLYGTWQGVVKPTNTPDTYTISATELRYDDNSPAYNFEYKGSITKIVTFDNASGVIIIQYTEVPASQGTVGGYFGVYYRDLSAGTVKMANAYDLSQNAYPSAASSGDADKMFTEGNAGKYVSVYGTYKR